MARAWILIIWGISGELAWWVSSIHEVGSLPKCSTLLGRLWVPRLAGQLVRVAWHSHKGRFPTLQHMCHLLAVEGLQGVSCWDSQIGRGYCPPLGA
jgi:hypothetical protein